MVRPREMSRVPSNAADPVTRLADLLDEQESVACLTSLLAAAIERRDRTATAMIDAGELSSTDVAVMLGCTKANVSRITKRVRGLDWGPGTGDLRLVS